MSCNFFFFFFYSTFFAPNSFIFDSTQKHGTNESFHIPPVGNDFYTLQYCCCRPFSRPGKYFSFHEFLHMIYGRKKTFISFYSTLFYSEILSHHIICTYFKEIFHDTTLLWTEFIVLVYDGHVINNVGPCNKFSDKKQNKRYYVLE